MLEKEGYIEKPEKNMDFNKTNSNEEQKSMKSDPFSLEEL